MTINEDELRYRFEIKTPLGRYSQHRVSGDVAEAIADINPGYLTADRRCWLTVEDKVENIRHTLSSRELAEEMRKAGYVYHEC